ncbi:coproporphyrinogen III oxidase, anaerobic [Kytococcus aerolatus]|uniref:Heme chaperone HemW n=1 Tax=Kytococcus aerolatus TaxID=592308 RepID=A0A212U283_9MICO|nr:radical SAM family heme chaperone HemW [Kytococcus aerolatus]SNC72367.1 coproporphyrinogen III oxidase, anaerobic [Kytococcus aerolatus]
MPQLPDGDPAPSDGALPGAALSRLSEGTFSLYLHVPYCSVRCGYCDFNTYTLTELGDATGASLATWVDAVEVELDLARRVLTADGRAAPVVDTVFVGGGTPSLLGATDLGRALAAVRERFAVAPDLEVTSEANPDQVDAAFARQLAAAGYTRLSVGMQSAVPHVLATLDRTHRPENVERAVSAARAAGLAVSVDLIHGTPGESVEDWRTSLEAAIALAPDHVSAYALTVEEGTALHRRVVRGELPTPDEDDQATKYELADELLGAAGYAWYELSNWARTERGRCRHNEHYWDGGHWWGVGPGAHSHVGGVRFWNVKHPRAWADRLGGGDSPAAGRELLTAEQVTEERVMLGIRRREGLSVEAVPRSGRSAVAPLIADGLLDGQAALAGQLVLTQRGRLLADLVTFRLLGL